jgi:hypothetical protein
MLTISVAKSRQTAFYQALGRLKQHMPITGVSTIIVRLVLAADRETLTAPSMVHPEQGDVSSDRTAQHAVKHRPSLPISVPAEQEGRFQEALHYLRSRWPSSSTSALIVSLVINTAALLDTEYDDQVHDPRSASPPLPPGVTRSGAWSAGALSMPPERLEAWARRLLDPTTHSFPDTLPRLWQIYATGQAQYLYPIAQQIAENVRLKPTHSSEHAAWHSTVFQFAASVLLGCGALDDAWALADQAVKLVREPGAADQRDSFRRLGAALYHRARITLQISQQPSSTAMRSMLLEKAAAGCTEALACVSEADCPYRAAIHACLAEILALLNGYSTDLAAHFDQALHLAPDEPIIDVTGVLPSVSMIRYQRARTTLHLHAQQQAQPAGDFSLDGAARDVDEAIRRLPMYQEWWHLDLLATQAELALARDTPDEAMRVADDLAFWLVCAYPGAQRIVVRYKHIMQRIQKAHPELFELAA